MKTAKLVIGILSMVLFLVVVLQSCAVGVGNAIVENDETSGSSGLLLAICMLVAGIVGVVTREKITGGFVAGGFYAVGGLIGITNYGSYSDLLIWSIICFAFAIVFIAGTIVAKKKGKQCDASKQGDTNEKTN